MNTQTYSNLNIVLWNANNISSKIQEFFNTLSTNSIHIACVSETCLAPGDLVPSNPSYILHRLDRDAQRRSGGVAIFVHKSIPHKLLPIANTKLLETISVEVSVQNGSKIRFVSMYLPGGASNTDIRRHLKDDIKILTNCRHSYFLMGDLNAKHRVWNCNRANAAGSILENEHQRQNFMIFFPPTPTHIPSDPQKTPSTIDLLLTNGIHNISQLSTSTSSSDHEYVHFNIQLTDDVAKLPPRKIPLFKEADWNKYRDILDSEFEVYEDVPLADIENTQQIDALINDFTETILRAQADSVPFVIPKRYHFKIEKDTLDKIRYRNAIKRRAQRNPHLRQQLTPLINHLNHEISRENKETSNANFNRKLSHIPPVNVNYSVWKTAKFLKNRGKGIPSLKVGGKTLITSEEKSDALANQFLLNHQNPLEADNISFTKLVNKRVTRFMRNCKIRDEDIRYTNVDELKGHIKKLKASKAPGLDKVHNTLIKNLPRKGIYVLALIINACLKLSYFPDNWKIAKVIALKKPDKPERDPASYRPISLLSTLSKLLERVIQSRLSDHLDLNHIIPNQQHGFRKSYSTVTQLYRITTHIQENLDLKPSNSTGMVLADIKKAFDRVWLDGLVYKMIVAKVPHYVIKIIYSFLNDRNFFVTVNGSNSAKHQPRYGVPQGAVLSPILYSLYTHDIPTESETCNVATFADDTALFASHRLSKPIETSLKKTFTKYKTYFTKWKIKMNDTKTKGIFYTRRRTKQRPTEPLQIEAASINWDTKVKYLGVMLNQTLTYQTHVEHICGKVHKATRILYSMLNRKSKLNLANKILLYKVAIRPIITYACPIYHKMARTHFRKLQILQNKLLRMILNAPYDAPTALVHQQTGIEKIEEVVATYTNSFLGNHHHQIQS